MVTVFLWSTVSIVSRLLMEKMDAITITSYRFFVAAIFLALFLHCKNYSFGGRKFRSLNDRMLILLVAGAFTVGAPLYAYALKFIPAGAAPIVYQVGSLAILVGGVTFFKERFTRMQVAGGALLVGGLVLLANRRMNEFAAGLSDYWFGAILVAAAAILWALSALAQKILLRTHSPIVIMAIVFSLGFLAMMPWFSPAQIRQLSSWEWVLLAYACANLMVGSVCFVEAMKHLEASRVSAITALNPLLAWGWARAAGAVWPERGVHEELNVGGMAGAVLVVVGAATIALARRERIDHET